jgi:hypothetical protein
MRRLALICLPLFFLCLLAAGCGSEGSVSGKVSYKGQPVKAGSIHFFPEKGQGGNFSSIIQPDGSYSVSKLPRGQAKITVDVSSGGGPPPAVFKQRGGAQIAAAMKKQGMDGKGGDTSLKVPPKFSDPEKSGLTIDVKGGSQTHNVDMGD